jgi:hypothetical protein
MVGGQIPDGLRAGCEEDEGKDCTAGPDFTIVRVHQQGAGARHAPRDPVPWPAELGLGCFLALPHGVIRRRVPRPF